MDLIPKEIKEKIPSLYSTEDEHDPTVFCKLFLDGWTWLIIELSIDEDICFGYVISPFGKELGYFSLDELKSLRGRLGIWIQRDLHFNPVKLSTIKKENL
jgi:hypothetical protein